MGVPGDIPVLDAPRDGGLVWLVDGTERPFEAAPERRRPWLEESVERGVPSGGPGADVAPAEGGEVLLWL